MTSHFVKLAATALLTGVMLSGCSVFGGERAENRVAARETNPGPCPRAFSLYETSRVVNFNGDRQTYANVGFTGEINNVRSLCRYYGTAPIDSNLEMDISFGRGPAAQASSHTFYYFVAVTRKNYDVLEKQYFPITVDFPAGENIVSIRETVDSIIIPRAKETTSGANFEIIVGFDLTPAQVAFNADGKRFRVSAGEQ